MSKDLQNKIEEIIKENWGDTRATVLDIEELVRQAKQEERERIKKEVGRLREEVLPTHAEENGYSHALEDILQALNQKES